MKGRLALNFGVQRDARLGTERRHLGVDFFAPLGSPVGAVHPGTVVHVGPLVGYGTVVIVAHGLGYHTVYALLRQAEVAEGAVVEAGARLGEIGADPLGEPPHLHFELRLRGQAQDPRVWFGR
jgi:septal ring factor EnvC (AmiA/AmiB activator)